MRKILLFTFLVFILASCRKNCSCSINETCIENKCVCAEWTEGTSCTPMRDKFKGTYIGSVSLNAGTPIPDTIYLNGDGKPINYLYSSNPSYPASPTIRSFGIHVEDTLRGIYYVDYKNTNLPNQYADNFNPIDCGNAELSSDRRTLKIFYHPVLNTGLIDLNNTYTFVGIKQ